MMIGQFNVLLVFCFLLDVLIVLLFSNDRWKIKLNLKQTRIVFHACQRLGIHELFITFNVSPFIILVHSFMSVSVNKKKHYAGPKAPVSIKKKFHKNFLRKYDFRWFELHEMNLFHYIHRCQSIQKKTGFISLQFTFFLLCTNEHTCGNMYLEVFICFQQKPTLSASI